MFLVWILPSVVVLLIKIETATATCRNPLKYFYLDSMLNYDIVLYTDICNEGIQNKNLRLSLGQLTIAVKNIGDLSRNYGQELQGQQYKNDVVLVFWPRNIVEFFEYFREVFEISNEFGITDKRFIFFIWSYVHDSKSESPENILSFMTMKNETFNSSLKLNSNIFVAFTGESSVLSLWGIYSIKGEIFTRSVRSVKQRIRIDDVLPKSSRRKNFFGVPITAIATAQPGYSAESKFSNRTGTLVLESGFAVNLYRDLRDILNFSESSITGGWMYISNNTVKGDQAVALLSEKADISISQNVMRTDLAKRFTFLQPTYPLSVIAFFREPSLGTLVEIYNEPFNTNIWILIIMVLISIPLLISIFRKCLYCNCFNSNFNQFVDAADQILETESIIWMIGTATQQGWYSFPNALPLRILFITGSLTSVVLYGAYSAALVSKLSVQMSPIQSMKDLVNFDYTFIYNTASVSLREYTKGLKSYYHVPRIIASDELGKDGMKRQTVVLSYWDGIEDVYPAANEAQFICESLQTLSVENTVVHTGMTLKKGSEYKEIFNQKILQIKERGFHHRYARQYDQTTRPQCLKKSMIRHAPLDLRSMLSAHLLLSVGFLAAFVVLILELQLLKLKPTKIEQKDTVAIVDSLVIWPQGFVSQFDLGRGNTPVANTYF